ncbi:MAG: GNAT family N-acetyltransferase [Lachnospiraceae bacterium]|nr:GNAT family N-acetyltransferase [Lachnospiraceae bacterium]
MKDYRKVTLEYYSKWLGQDEILLHDFDGVRYLYSKERNKVPYGYGGAFDIYIFVMGSSVVVSYGDKAKERIDELQNKMAGRSVDEIKLLIKKIYEKKPKHNVKYVLHEILTVDESVKVLTCEDYEKYEEFFRKCNPKCGSLGWLGEYFAEMVQEHICVGVFDNDILVSCTDAPGMAYMPESVQEIGINTLPEYRGRGYAAKVCRKCVLKMIESGKIPQWSTSVDNIASQKLAEKTGFVKLADVVTAEL